MTVEGEKMATSSCTISFFRNDLESTDGNKCPVKNCTVKVQNYLVPFKRYKGQMKYKPFCPEHGIRIHKNTFVYYNGPDLATATKRNLMFNADYYVANIFNKPGKVESHRLCYETSEDAVTYNVFTELLANGQAIKQLVGHITGQEVGENVELYLWGGKIDLKNNSFSPYEPLKKVHKELEQGIGIPTEPDIMLIVPSKIIICIEAKFGSKNPLAKEKEEKIGEKPKSWKKLKERYCDKNDIIDGGREIFDFNNSPTLFYEQLFRNLVFAASMAKLGGIEEWYVANLRSEHIMNLKRGEPESKPVVRSIQKILKPEYKKNFVHLTWEELYEKCVKSDMSLANLSWYLKNKSFECRRAFNIF